MQGIANRTKVHQNKFAFAHNPNSKKSARIMGIPNVGLCQRCHDIIEWRKKFRKYKPIKNLTKCACCQEKKVRSAYHNWCTDCAKASNVCPKCLLNRDIVEKEAVALDQDSIQEMLVQVGMKERIRRKIWRLWENNKATDAEIKEMIFNYNPDAKDEPDDDEESKEDATGPSSSSNAAARGPPPKPKAPAPKPASTTLSSASSETATTSTPATNEHEDDDEEEDEEDGEDYLDESEDGDEDAPDETAIVQAALARLQTAGRGPPPKPKQAAKPATTSSESSAAAGN